MHHKAYYRTVNGKVVHVGEGGEGQGRPAELHERTAIGKHKSGTHYLRASDAEDGSKIKRAADELGIHTEKRRAGANHFGRVGAYDHYHTSSLQDAQAIHSHLRRAADARHTEPDERPRGAAVSDRDDQSDERGGKVAPTDSRTAFNHTSEAQVATDEADRAQTPEAHEAAAEAHKKAENAHFAAQRTAENEQDGDIHQIARGGHAYNVTRHKAEAARLRGAATEAADRETVASKATAHAIRMSDSAREGGRASHHSRAAEAHGAARQAHYDAQDSANDGPGVEHHRERREFHGKLQEHHERMAREAASSEAAEMAADDQDKAHTPSKRALTRTRSMTDQNSRDVTADAHSATVRATHPEATAEQHMAAALAHTKAFDHHTRKTEGEATNHGPHQMAANDHLAAMQAHKAAARRIGRPMEKAMIEAQFNHLDRMKTKVGGDPVALAALELRRAAIANQTEQE